MGSTVGLWLEKETDLRRKKLLLGKDLLAVLVFHTSREAPGQCLHRTKARSCRGAPHQFPNYPRSHSSSASLYLLQFSVDKLMGTIRSVSIE